MHDKLATWAVGIAALAWAGSLQAHHSISMIDITTPIWVKGTVVRYEPINPHAVIALEEKLKDGQVRQWTVEGPILARLTRMGVGRDVLKSGDSIEVCGFALKANLLTGNLPRLFLHGHMLVMPDGRLQPWGPYGKLDNCVRPDDRQQSWLDFLNGDPIARDLWCARVATLPPASTVSTAFVQSINRLMAHPCS
jgi:hypothetical protein